MQPGNIYIFDLHNTLYDEVIEFGCAITKATNYLFQQAEAQNKTIDKELFFQQLSDAHARAGSDWDNDVWNEIPELRKLEEFETIRDKVVAIRSAASEKLTKSTAYQDTIQTIKELKRACHIVYIATEATQNAASDGVAWLGLDGIVDGVYAWPFKKPYEQKLVKTQVASFPANPHNPEQSLQKPHPLILGAIILEEAKRQHLVPDTVCIEGVFDFSIDPEIDVTSLEQKIFAHKSNGRQKIQAQESLRAICTIMTVKEGPYKKTINEIKARCFYVGDSFFKDGFLARNADVPFIYAAYGKNTAPENQNLHRHAMETLFRVTGWDKFLIKLTQEAGALPALMDKIHPFYTCENSFREFIEFSLLI